MDKDFLGHSTTDPYRNLGLAVCIPKVTYVEVIQCRLSQVFLAGSEPLENDIVRACKKEGVQSIGSKGIQATSTFPEAPQD